MIHTPTAALSLTLPTLSLQVDVHGVILLSAVLRLGEIEAAKHAVCSQVLTPAHAVTMLLELASKLLAAENLPTLTSAMLPAIELSKPHDASKLLAMLIAVLTLAATMRALVRYLKVSLHPSARSLLLELL